VEQPVKELALAAPAQEAILVETEHLPKSESKRSAEIPDQDALQALFMTEEFLSVDRVVELCGSLPGIKSCVLAHGSAVLGSDNVPESIDLVSLSAHALEMLAAMRQSAARMGIGAVPAVTIHSEKGPITFFHQDDLCLLVMHKDRGFVPGVREKLQQVVEHLSEANLALPVGASRPALAQKEATF
jgi:predicted regulator of Ras-like GTPase activity (Roadblock/LC7/MglB family)